MSLNERNDSVKMERTNRRACNKRSKGKKYGEHEKLCDWFGKNTLSCKVTIEKFQPMNYISHKKYLVVKKMKTMLVCYYLG